MLKKEICRKCLAREHGFEEEEKTGNVNCYPSLNKYEIQEFFEIFEKEWNYGKKKSIIN